MRRSFNPGLAMEETSTHEAPLDGRREGYEESEQAERDPALGPLGNEPIEGKGPLLEEPDEGKVARKVNKLREDQDDVMGPRLARWKANEKRRRGVPGVQVIRAGDQDKAEWKVYAPPGSSRVPPTFNKASRLCRRLKANLFVDPPVPEATPGEASSPEDPDAAEFATRILQELSSNTGVNLPRLARRAFDLASTYDSGFIRFWPDLRGERRPKTIIASAAATTVADAVTATITRPVPVSDPMTGQPAVDPMTGQPAMQVDELGQPVTETVTLPQPTPYLVRYVKPVAEGAPPESAELTDDPSEADEEWVPRLRAELLTGRNLLVLPESAPDIENAAGVLIPCFKKLGELRRLPRVAAMSEEELAKLCAYRPKDPRRYLPQHIKKTHDFEKGADADQKVPDDVDVFVHFVYYDGRVADEYEDGAYLIVGGEDFVLHRQTWAEKVDGVTQRLFIPVAQSRQFEEGETDFFGFGLMHLLGSGNEVRASVVGVAIEYLHKINNAKTFYSPTSLFQPKANIGSELYVPIEPGSEPKREQFADFPRIGDKLLDVATSELDDEAGIAPVAQGNAEPSVQSGLHAQRLIEQTNVALSDVKQNTDDFIVRCWQIMQQLAKCYFTVPMQFKATGENAPHKREQWSGADLASNIDIRIMRGSFTMLAPSAKLAVAEYAASLGMLSGPQLRRIWGGNVGGQLGVQDDPHQLRIERQVREFLKGPPKDTNPADWPSIAASIFMPMPNDMEPEVALIRHDELSRTMSTVRYAALPPEWRMFYEQQYQLMRQAAGVQTIAEQQMAAMAAAMPPGSPQEAGSPPPAGDGSLAAPAPAAGQLPAAPASGLMA